MTASTTAGLVAWLREQIAEDEAKARAATAGPWVKDTGSGYVHGGQDCRFVIAAQVPPWNSAHITRHDPRAVLAQCEAHTAILDFVEANSPDHIEVDTNDHGGDFLGAMFLALKMQDLLAAVATAYQHRPGYEDAIATLKTTRTEVRLSLSDKARGDELAARRYKTDLPDGDRA